ncbi:hypothetical protein CANINC_000887 [Pichia inconspicua]|uniref:Protein kinase domain-containing protein n=1 Tax=Pichia inconspicua TaxID=52247 RepID=A0A4T0X5H2_9ASCO|nr:hypothetical protein CANINC_000887 [[Candida] inconspicua]
MSLVRYNTSDVLEYSDTGKELTVVYKNEESGEVVLYNRTLNDFEVIKLEVPFGNNNSELPSNDNHRNRRRNSSRQHQGQNTGFVCRVCGAYNDFNHAGASRSSTSPSNHRRKSFASSSSALELETDPILRYSNGLTLSHPMANIYDFTTNSSGNLIRGDYFKLLQNSMFRKQENDSLLSIDDGDEFSDHVEFKSISEKIINQGYFDKFFKILSKLGSGSYGSVYKVEHELLGLNLGVFALKKIPIGDDVNNLKKILNEVKFLYDLSCNITENNHNNSNIVKYNHVWIEVDQVSRFSPKIPVVFLLFEYCAGGTLEDFVESMKDPKYNIIEEKLLRKKKMKHSKKSRLLNNYEIFKIFTDITKGLNYLHDLNILHRDLKPSNCLFKTEIDRLYQPITSLDELDKIPTLLVSDFGESIMVSSIEDKWQNNLSTGNTGTLEFCAPEIINRRKSEGKSGAFSYSSDVYSLGMMLYYLCFGKLPFTSEKDDPEEISKQILSTGLFENLYDLRTTENSGLLVDWIVLIDALVSPNPEDRPNTNQILTILDGIGLKLKAEMITNSEGLDDRDNDSVCSSDNEKDLNSDYQETMSSTGHLTMLTMFIINFTLQLYCKYSVLINAQCLVIGGYVAGYKPVLQVVYAELVLTIITLFYAVLSLFKLV